MMDQEGVRLVIQVYEALVSVAGGELLYSLKD